MPWFRRRKKDESDVAAAAAVALPEPELEPAVEEPEPAASEEDGAAPGDPTKPKRRRGSRGGRNRKKPGETGAAETAPAETSDQPRKAGWWSRRFGNRE